MPLDFIETNQSPVKVIAAHNLAIKAYLADQVSPLANQLDSDSALLFEAFGKLGEQGWLIPKCPEDWGGLGLNVHEHWQFQSLMAQHSGALAFLQTQHQSAASLLLASENERLKTYLSAMATGEKRLGVGFSQLRRQPPPLIAKRVAGGYRLSGEVPWVSGAGLFTDFVGAAVLPSGEAVFGLLPLVCRQKAEGQVEVSEPMALCAVAATNTVRVLLSDWFLADENVLGQRPAGWIEQRDRANPLSPLPLMFGCTQAGIDVTVRSLTRRQIEQPIAAQLTVQLEQLQAELHQAVRLPVSAFAQKIALRGRAISLMHTAAQAAIISASGAANGLNHPAQRIYRESLLFSVSGQTPAAAIASLDVLSVTARS